MNVAITQRILLNEHGSKIDSLEQAYVSYYSQFGINLIPVPNSLKHVSKFIKECNIKKIIFSGGGDIQPSLWGGKSLTHHFYQEERDDLEAKLLQFALKRNIPVLGICRGAQMINVLLGGYLVQDLNQNSLKRLNHVKSTHRLIWEKNSKFPLPLRKKISVNSFHNQGFSLRELSPQLQSFAYTEDGIVEGFYHKKKHCIGILWHPERKSPHPEFCDSIIKFWLRQK